MILEVASLQIIPGQEKRFESNFKKAQSIISAMPGYISHELQHSIQDSQKYILLVKWKTKEHHTEGFRKSEEYQRWKELLHHFYNPFPKVEYYNSVFSG